MARSSDNSGGLRGTSRPGYLGRPESPNRTVHPRTVACAGRGIPGQADRDVGRAISLTAWLPSVPTSTPLTRSPRPTAAGADAVQFFLADPQGWKAPVEHPHAAEIRASDLTIYIHAPYIVNVATMNNKIRIPSRKILEPARRGRRRDRRQGPDRARRPRPQEDDYDKGFDNWRKTFSRAAG